MSEKTVNHVTEKTKILLLNASWEVVRLISWQRAVCLLMQNKALPPGAYDHHFDVQTSDGVFSLPSAIVLKKFVHVPFHSMRPTRRNIFRRDGFTCQYTGKRLSVQEATIDHIIPTSRGGKNTWANMVTCSREVNIRKGNRPLNETTLKLIREPKAPSRTDLLIGINPEIEEWKQFLPQK